MMSVLIYGAGAVGLGVASCLLAAGVSVSLVARSSTVAALNRKGLSRTGIFGSVHHDPAEFRAADSLDPFLTERPDCVLICTKSFDTEAAGRDLSRLHAAEPLFVLFQNGWGNRERIIDYLPAERVYNARVITGFARSDPAAVEITVHADDIRIGHFDGLRHERIETLCGAVTEGGVPCSPTDDITGDLWAKMLYNCSLNALGGICEMNYGELADNPHTRELLDRIIDECFAVMERAGFRTHWESAEEYREIFYGSLVPATREHYPSTLQDLRAGKRTEIDALNGAVIRLAEERGVDAPYNRMAFSLIKHKETR
jgi:2-dehydropantoate 2-reductase